MWIKSTIFVIQSFSNLMSIRLFRLECSGSLRSAFSAILFQILSKFEISRDLQVWRYPKSNKDVLEVGLSATIIFRTRIIGMEWAENLKLRFYLRHRRFRKLSHSSVKMFGGKNKSVFFIFLIGGWMGVTIFFFHIVGYFQFSCKPHIDVMIRSSVVIYLGRF